MLRPHRTRLLSPVILLLLLCCGCSDTVEAKREIVIGLNPSERSENTTRNADLLAEAIERRLGMPVTIFVAHDYSGLVEALRARRIDFAFFAPISYVHAERIADAVVLLKAERAGNPYYFGCIVVDAASSYRTLADLKGKRIAWVDPASASGHIFPKAALIEAGYDPETFFAAQTFAGGHDAVLLAVINGTIDAGATFANDTLGRSGSWSQLEEGSMSGRVRPIFYSQRIPGDNISTSRWMIDNHPDLVRRLTDAIATMGEDSAGRAVMTALYHVDAMVPATPDDYEPVRRAAALLDLDITGEIGRDDPDAIARDRRNTLYSWLFVGAIALAGVAALWRGRRRRPAPSDNGSASATPPVVAAQIVLRGIVVDYHDRSGAVVRALDGVDLAIAPGAFVAIIGPSGSGKSTLLRTVNLIVPPTAGRVLFDGRDVTSLRGEELLRYRRRVGFIFQGFNLVPSLSALRNVAAGRLGRVGKVRGALGVLPAAEWGTARRYLEEVGLGGREKSRASDLSGGQQQRVAIARALAQEPDAILADEPTASLDPVRAASILELLAQINRERGITIVANLHSVEYARAHASRIVGLCDGRIVFDGAPQQVTDEVVAAIYGEEWMGKGGQGGA